MKNPRVLILGLLLLCGCHKTIEKKAEDAIMKAMTDGQWVITNFAVNGTNITSSFTNYKFQYFENYTVNAIHNGIVEQTGNWQGDVNTMNIYASFQNASSPIDLINGTWHITDNGWTYVIASLTVGNEVRTLRLDKQ